MKDRPIFVQFTFFGLMYVFCFHFLTMIHLCIMLYKYMCTGRPWTHVTRSSLTSEGHQVSQRYT